MNDKQYGLAAGVFSQSLKSMSVEEKALMKYKLGICYKELDKTLESLKSFTEAIEILPSYKNAYLEAMRIFEKLELWSDLELYVKKAIENVNENNSIDENVEEYWKGILFIQATLALVKQNKLFAAYGYAALALESPLDDGRKRIAEYNFNEIKKGLWETLQIDD